MKTTLKALVCTLLTIVPMVIVSVIFAVTCDWTREMYLICVFGSMALWCMYNIWIDKLKDK